MAVLLDVSAIVAAADTADLNHDAARAWFGRVDEPLLLGALTLGEADHVLQRELGQPAARTRSSWVGATTRIAPLVSASTRASAAGWPSSRWRTWSASPRVSAPSRSGSSTRPNQARAAAWLRSAVSAAATIADTSSSTAMPQPPPSARGRAPTSRPAIRRASRDRRPWALRPTPVSYTHLTLPTIYSV